MALVIYGNESIARLKELVAKEFVHIPKVEESRSTVALNDGSLPCGQTGKVVFYKADSNNHTLSLYWQVHYYSMYAYS